MPHKAAVMARLLLERVDPLPLVTLVAAVRLKDWWSLRLRRLQRRLLLEEAP